MYFIGTIKITVTHHFYINDEFQSQFLNCFYFNKGPLEEKNTPVDVNPFVALQLQDRRPNTVSLPFGNVIIIRFK